MTADDKQDNNLDDIEEEARLEASLDNLKDLYLKLRALRRTLPTMVRPLQTESQQSPDAFFSAFQKSVADANREISAVQAAFATEENKKLLDDADASRQARPKGIRPWRPTNHPNWTTPTKKT